MTIYELIILSCQEHFSATINWIHAILLESPLWNRNICFTGYTHQGWEVLRAVLTFKVSLCWGACKINEKAPQKVCFWMIDDEVACLHVLMTDPWIFLWVNFVALYVAVKGFIYFIALHFADQRLQFLVL